MCDAAVSRSRAQTLLALITLRSLALTAMLNELRNLDFHAAIIIAKNKPHRALLSKMLLNLRQRKVYSATLVRAEEGSFFVSLFDELMHLVSCWRLLLALAAVALEYLTATLEGHASFADSALTLGAFSRVNRKLLTVGAFELREYLVLPCVEKMKLILKLTDTAVSF